MKPVSEELGKALEQVALKEAKNKLLTMRDKRAFMSGVFLICTLLFIALCALFGRSQTVFITVSLLLAIASYIILKLNDRTIKKVRARMADVGMEDEFDNVFPEQRISRTDALN